MAVVQPASALQLPSKLLRFSRNDKRQKRYDAHTYYVYCCYIGVICTDENDTTTMFNDDYMMECTCGIQEAKEALARGEIVSVKKEHKSKKQGETSLAHAHPFSPLLSYTYEQRCILFTFVSFTCLIVSEKAKKAIMSDLLGGEILFWGLCLLLNNLVFPLSCFIRGVPPSFLLVCFLFADSRLHFDQCTNPGVDDLEGKKKKKSNMDALFGGGDDDDLFGGGGSDLFGGGGGGGGSLFGGGATSRRTAASLFGGDDDDDGFDLEIAEAPIVLEASPPPRTSSISIEVTAHSFFLSSFDHPALPYSNHSLSYPSGPFAPIVRAVRCSSRECSRWKVHRRCWDAPRCGERCRTDASWHALLQRSWNPRHDGKKWVRQIQFMEIHWRYALSLSLLCLSVVLFIFAKLNPGIMYVQVTLHCSFTFATTCFRLYPSFFLSSEPFCVFMMKCIYY